MRKPIRYLIAAVFAVLSAVISISCTESLDGEDPGDISRISITGGNNQSERVGAELSDPLVVRVTTLAGYPRAGMTVRFSTDDAGASVSPAVTITDSEGYAASYFRLGSDSGTQHAGASIDGDTATFSFTAVPIGCDEESPDATCLWESGHAYITTTSSSLISGSGSVLIKCDPEDGSTDLVLETDMVLTDIAFSPRGELFVTTTTDVYKLEPGSENLTHYADLPLVTGNEIEPNFGGVLLMAGGSNVYTIGCPGEPASLLANYVSLLYENLAVDPVTRDFYVITGTTPIFRFTLNEWDGRGSVSGTVIFDLDTGVGTPRGICVDENGVLYISIDSDRSSRSIGRIDPGVSSDPAWFDFYEYFSGNDQTSGRWGDIASYGDKLYLIDTRMNRFVVLWTGGTTDEEKWYAEYSSTEFSKALTDSEKYGIAAAPDLICAFP